MSEHAEELRARGFTVFEGLVAAAEATAYATRLRELWSRLGAPPVVAREDVVLAPGVHVSPVGVTFASVLARIPELAAVLMVPELRALMAEVLGPGHALEYGAGVLSDETRPYFFWHNHVGGIDAEDHRRAAPPDYGRVERLVCTLYAAPLDDDHGVMHVWPRAAAGPTAPPFTPGATPWPGAFELRAPIGSVVIFDQGTWHAVTPMRPRGQRCFFGFFVRRAGLAPTTRRDPEMAAVFARDPALARAYGGER